jgi:hypothetical protein
LAGNAPGAMRGAAVSMAHGGAPACTASIGMGGDGVMSADVGAGGSSLGVSGAVGSSSLSVGGGMGGSSSPLPPSASKVLQDPLNRLEEVSTTL